ncbi:MAG: preprotein translocase subunit SecA [Woeseiaceae bacterium]|nr:preprotein translocase subunit SecA [Woeseiaceae bacterium]
MFDSLLAKVFGTKNERDLKRLTPLIAQINDREAAFTPLSDQDLRSNTVTFRNRLEQGEPLDDVLPDAFAVVREAGRRTLQMRHFDVQLIGGLMLHRGTIAEMKTGEGKTLVATLPAYLNALTGKGVHVVTVNDYLARRDSEWMGQIYRFLGLSVGVVQHDKKDLQRKESYAADITYGTNNEFGFDYLRDNMKFNLSHHVQRGHHFAIVDEVDSILIDEARTPLIISGPAEESNQLYEEVNRIVPKLKAGAVTQGDVKGEDRDALETTGDYITDEKHKTVSLTESGMAKTETILAHRLSPGGLYDPLNMPLLHHVNQALRAHTLFQRDVDYMIKDGQVVIVDEFTGRLMPGRRWSDGLHQAVEAKEKVKVERENQTLATVTFQNYFRKYEKLSGMTGTADTEAPEFAKIYNLDVAVIPTNRTLLRLEEPDTIYRTEQEKFNAIVSDIAEQKEAGRPVLVGTVSIEKSERLSSLLKRNGVKHVVLNAKYHAKEAEIVAQAGRKGTVTIATNMAGRGTDILLGGNPEFMARQQCLADETAERLSKEEGSLSDDEDFIHFYHLDNFYRVAKATWKKQFSKFTELTAVEHDEVVAAGGLHIIATERHEARRIDNQLRGRAGRQGDPGSSRFYLSLEDDLMRIFGSDRISGLMQSLGMEEGVPIEHKMVTRAIERAQRQVEAQNFSVRKHLLEYDDVMNKQRESVYGLRRELLKGQIQLTETEKVDTRQYLMTLGEEAIDETLESTCGPQVDPEDWDIDELKKFTSELFGLAPSELETLDLQDLDVEGIREVLWQQACAKYEEKEKNLESSLLRQLERDVMLQIVDAQWKDHLYGLDHLKDGIGLRGYGQRDPLVEYKRESFALFQAMKVRIDEEIIKYLWRIRPVMKTVESGLAKETPEASTAGLTFNNPGQPASSFPKTTAPITNPNSPRTGGDDAKVRTIRRDAPKVGRNDPCPCGSGKKYKKCHGR